MKTKFENSVNLIYTNNIEDVKDFRQYTSPNTFVVSSYNYNKYHNYENYSGISYELYYIDNDQHIQQLTYNLIEGNGIRLKDNKITINIDNNTLYSKFDKETSSYYIDVNIDNFKESSYLNSGLLKIDNDLYYNDNYKDNLSKNGAFKLNDSIELSSGLISELQLIKYYYNSCINRMNDIDNLYKLCLIEIGQNVFFKVGDIIYYNIINKKYSFSQSEDNIPYMVCVIASNVLPDRQPRFIKLDRDNDKHIFDKSSSLYVKSSYSSVPNYNTNKLSYINISTPVVNSSYGFIATNNNNWKNNYANPVNKNEYYYANIPQMHRYELTYSAIPQQVDNYYNLYWYCDMSKVSLENYQILPYGIYSDILDYEILNKYEDQNLEFLFHIEYSNGIIKKYKTNFVIEDKRLLNKEVLYPYDSINSIINNYSVSSVSELDSLRQTRKETNGNITFTYISYYDTTRNIDILSNSAATNIYTEYGNNDNWYRQYNQGIIGDKIGSNESFEQYQYMINQIRINLKIEPGLCNQDCYLKVSLCLKNSTIHSVYYIKYNNSTGIHYLLADIQSSNIDNNSWIAIECYQMGDYSGTPHKLPHIKILSSSDKVYGYGGIIVNCIVKSYIYGFSFTPIIETISINTVYKDYWKYNNNITNYLTLLDTANLVNYSNIQITKSSNYWIDFNKSNCSNNNYIYLNDQYKQIHIHPNGIVIDIENCYSDYDWKKYDTYLVDFDIYYIYRNDNQLKIEYYKEISFSLTGKKLALNQIIFIPKNAGITKIIINNIYTSNKNFTNIINPASQGEIKNFESIKKYMNYDFNNSEYINNLVSTEISV